MMPPHGFVDYILVVVYVLTTAWIIRLIKGRWLIGFEFDGTKITKVEWTRSFKELVTRGIK